MTLKSIFCIQLKIIFQAICRQDFRLPNCVSILLNSFVNLSRYTYTNDERFRAIHKVKSEDYMLQILPIQVLVITDSSNAAFQSDISKVLISSLISEI